LTLYFLRPCFLFIRQNPVLRQAVDE